MPPSTLQPNPTPVQDFSRQVRLFALLGFVLCLAFVVVVVVTAIQSRILASQMAFDFTREVAFRQASQVESIIGGAMGTAQGLSALFEHAVRNRKTIDRHWYDRFVIETLQRADPFVFGVWAVFEPNRFDGRDAEFAGKPGQASDGGYIPFAYRRGEGWVFKHDEFSLDKDMDYYVLPKEARRPCVINPYADPDAENVLMTSVTIPILEGTEVIGVTGLDMLLTTFNDLVADIHPLKTGYAFLLGNNLLVVGHPNPGLAGKTLSDLGVPQEVGDEVKRGMERVWTGPDLRTGETTFFQFVPVNLPGVSRPWAMAVAVPQSEVLALANTVTARTGMVGIVSLMILGTMLFLLARAVILPLHRSEAALRTSEERFRTLAEWTPAIIYEIDSQGILSYVNQYGFTASGYSREDFERGFSAVTLFAPEEREEVKANLVRCLQGEDLEAKERMAIRKDGSRICFLNKASPIFLDGNVVGVRGILLDVTANKQAMNDLLAAKEAAEAANRAKTDFLAMMSHELRTPLSGILAYSLMLSDPEGPLSGKTGPEVRDFSRRISGGARHLLGLIEDILQFSRIEIGKLQLEPKPFPLADLTEFTRSEGDILAQCGGPQFLLIEPGVPLEVTGDQQALRQIVVNLLGNAFKFTKEGRVLAAFEFTPPDLTIVVQDTGIGIPPEERERIFEPFYQISQGKTRTHPGTGLGLAVVKRLLKEMGGTITVEETPGGGTRFRVLVPGVLRPPTIR